MVVSAGFLLIVGGIFACAPLFKRVSNVLERLMVLLGFFVGIAVIIVAIDVGLGLNFLSTYLGIQPVPTSTTNQYIQYYLVVMAVLGIMLFSRPIRKVRWASLVGLGAGILAAVLLKTFFVGLSSTVLIIVFLVVTLLVYFVLKFVEDIMQTIGSILAFPPIAIAIGLVSIYFGIITIGAA